MKMLKLFLTLLFLTLFCVPTILFGYSVEAQLPGQRQDVDVYIRELTVTKIMDTYVSDVFVIAEVNPVPLLPQYTAGSAKSQVWTVKGTGGHPYQGYHTLFKNVPRNVEGAYVVNVEVWDDDTWFRGSDDLMAKVQVVLTERVNEGSESVNGPGANLTVDVTAMKTCSSQDAIGGFVLVERQKKQKSPDWEITLIMNVTEASPPSDVTLIEQFPGGFTLVSASPEPNIIYDVIITDDDGSTYILKTLKWYFYGKEVYDRKITYVVSPIAQAYPEFGGELKTSTISLITTEPSVGGVGGFIVPVDKFGLLAPYIGLTSTIIVAAVAAAIYVKRVKHRKEKQ